MVGTEYVVSLDIGTQSVRAIVFDRLGNQIEKERILNKPYYSLEPGWAEVEANEYWSNLCIVLKKLMEKMGDEKYSIKACSITANRDNIIPLDENGDYIRDWITWIDQRRVPEFKSEDILKFSSKGKLLSIFGKKTFEMLGYQSKFNWFKYHEPKTYEKADKYLSIAGLITYKLTGEFKDSIGMQVGVLPIDHEKLKYHDLDIVYDVIGVRKDQLPKLCKPNEIMGYVTKEASKLTLLPEGLPIVAAGGDKQCETLGSGCFKDGQAVISYGTLATIAITSKKYVKNKNNTYYTWPSSIPDAWNPEFNIYRGYWLITWFCRQYVEEKGFPDLIDEMNEKAKDVPPGSNGLFVYPYWTPHPALCPMARGGIIGWTDYHKKEHLYRAILEGIAYALRDGLEIIEKDTKRKIEELYVVGGGSQSDVSMQLTADIFNLPVKRLSTHEVCGVGAAINAARAINMFRSEEEAVKNMTKVSQVFTPIKGNVEVYDDIYKNVYKQMYANEKNVFNVLTRYC